MLPEVIFVDLIRMLRRLCARAKAPFAPSTLIFSGISKEEPAFAVTPANSPALPSFLSLFLSAVWTFYRKVTFTAFDAAP